MARSTAQPASPARAHAGLRLARSDDAGDIARIYAPNVAASLISLEEQPPAAAATLETTPWLVCERAGTLVGYAYATRHRERAGYRWSLDASVYVAPDARRL